MKPLSSFFHYFQTDVTGIPLPEHFTYPFYYHPHPLCVAAADQVYQQLERDPWGFGFGMEDVAKGPASETSRGDTVNKITGHGKMFGILVAKDPHGQLGYLVAFSGKIGERSQSDGFVPPIFDVFATQNHFSEQTKIINDINQQIASLKNDHALSAIEDKFAAQKIMAENHIEQQRLLNISQRAERKKKRADAHLLSDDDLRLLQAELAAQSIIDKKTLAALKDKWQCKLNEMDTKRAAYQQQIEQLTNERKKRSLSLQRHIFEQFQFLNALGQSQSLNDLFAGNNQSPPAGAGECAAPKLLNFAYQHQLTPLALSEFWWGASPKSEIRQHKQFYPACQSRCLPILTHMLKGLSVESNPLETPWAEDTPMQILHQDESIVVINKPAGLLSIPGKTVIDSAYERVKKLVADPDGVKVIHRLDMATSGLLVFALTQEATRSLQHQFVRREVSKVYLALLAGVLKDDSGEITLPLRGDPDDRPRQLVCFEHGKSALTHWRKLGVEGDNTRVQLYPHTGRTHQLRIHCAHQLGLNIPILGDGLYGLRAKRLYLHAEQLSFKHPLTGELLSFRAEADF